MRPPANILLLIIAAAAVLVPVQAFAVSTTFTFAGFDVDANGVTRAASAKFVINNTQLDLRLTNLAPTAAKEPTEILTAVFFDLQPGTPALTPGSALVAPGSMINTNNVLTAGSVVGGEWAYAYGTLAYNGDQGISSSGFGLFGSANFPGPNIQGPVAVDGAQYGIIGPHGIATDQNGNPVSPLRSTGPKPQSFIQNAVDFTLTDGNLTGYKVSNVVFQYGTSLLDPHFVPAGGGGPPAVPEPLTVIGVFAGLCGLAGYVRKRTRA